MPCRNIILNKFVTYVEYQDTLSIHHTLKASIINLCKDKCKTLARQCLLHYVYAHIVHCRVVPVCMTLNTNRLLKSESKQHITIIIFSLYLSNQYKKIGVYIFNSQTLMRTQDSKIAAESGRMGRVCVHLS